MIIFAVVTFGFEQTSYPAMEDQGTVEVCAILVSGSLEDVVTVLLSTQNGTAKGNQMNIDYCSV